MQKHYLIALLFLAFSGVVSANPVTPSGAKKTAQEFFKKNGLTMQKEAYRAPRKANGRAKTDEAAFYVFNAEERGFVIVSGDDRTVDILGYSTTGRFDQARVPAHVKSWLQHYADEIEALGNAKVLRRKIIDIHDEITPKLTTKWDQAAPYNLQCPNNSMTGCMATATAQVMKYHQWPQGQMPEGLEGYTTKTLGIQVPSLEATTFDWDNMLDVYDKEATDEQKAAVAKLMRYCGQICEMNYTSSVSGANRYFTERFVSKFDYAPGVRHETAKSYSIAAWDELIYNEISNNRPVLYEGYSTGGGHAFVLDGYKDGLYHVNWGWSGDLDGYFRLTVMEPGDGGIGASTTADGYSCDQGAVIGMQPSSRGEFVKPKYLIGNLVKMQAGSQSVNMTFTLYNETGSQTRFEHGIARLNDDFSINPAQVYHIGRTNMGNDDGTYESYNLDSEHGLLPGTTANFVPVAREESTGTWYKAFRDGVYFSVKTVEENGVNSYLLTAHPIEKLQGTITIEEGDHSIGMPQNLLVAVDNLAEEFQGELHLYIHTPQSNKDILVSYTGAAMEQGSSETFKFSFAPTEVGTYTIYITSDFGGQTINQEYILGKNVVAQTTLEIEPSPIQCTAHRYEHLADQAGNPAGARLTLQIRNDGKKDYNAPIVAWIHQELFSNYYKKLGWANTPTASIPINSTLDCVFTFKNGLEANKNYKAEIAYAKDYASTMLSDYIIFDTIFFTVESPTGIVSVDAEQPENIDFYTVDGIRIGEKPTKKGIYISKGKKVVVAR